MTNLNAEGKSSILKDAYRSLREHLRIPLFSNAYALIVNQVLTAGLGFLYWIVAARLYPVEVVGRNSAILSTVLFLAVLSELCFKAGAIRYIPRAGKDTRKLLLGALGINLTAALLMGTFVVTVGRHFSLTRELMEGIDFWPGWLVLAGMLWCVFYVQDGILTGFRQAKWVAVKNSLHSIVKIILLFALFRFASGYGIVISWFSPVLIFVACIYALIFWWLIPRTSFGNGSLTRPITRREVVQSISGDYVGNLLVETCVRMLPLLVLSQLGESNTAFYYQAWIVANPIYMVASGMTQSFAVEASANMREISHTSRRILRQMVLLIVPVIALVFLAAPWIMGVFGPSYAIESSGLLRWLMLGALPLIVNYWFLNYSRVTGNGKAIILVQGVTSAVTLAISTLWLSKGGIASIGIAWFVAQCVIAVPVLIKHAPLLFKPQKQDTFGEHTRQNRDLRRVDWRFLLPAEHYQKVIDLSRDIDLHQALSACFPGGVETPASRPSPGHDLAVAINPSSASLHAAAAALRPGGIAYTEWSAWRMGGRKGILGRLRSAGFTHARLFLPFPSPVYPKSWLPLDSSDAPSEYIAGWLFPRNNSLHRVGRWGFKGLLRFTLRTGLVPCISAVASRGDSSTPDIFQHIRQEWSTRNPGKPAGELSFLVQTPGALSSNNIIFLAFPRPGSQPAWVLKIPRLVEGIQSLQKERDLLDELYQSTRGWESPIHLPKPVFQFNYGQVQAFCQTHVPGVPLHKNLQPGALREVALQLTEWQVSLHRISAGWHRKSSSRQVVEDLFSGIMVELGDREELAADLTQTRILLSDLDDLPLVCVHNDFTLWNARQEAERLAFFDWTDASRSGLPLLDLVYGLTSTVFILEKTWDSPVRACHLYRKLLDPSTASGALFAECLTHYARQVGLEVERIPTLRLLTWVLNVGFELQLRRFEVGSIPRPFSSMYFSLWKTELEIQKQLKGTN